MSGLLRGKVTDVWTNITPKILSYADRKLHLRENHPLCIIKKQITNYFYKSFTNSKGNPVFSLHDTLNPVVSVEQNFDNLLIPKSHVSRGKSECYYVNENYLLRAHTTAHQVDLIRSGLDNYLVCGDVYRRDEIDATHYPVFHQLDGARLLSRDKLFVKNQHLEIFERSYKSIPQNDVIPDSSKLIDQSKQPMHTIEAVKLMEHELKTVLIGLTKELFGNNIEYRWVDVYFPFTQPSWELEIFYKGKWMEVLGSGIMKNQILDNAGVKDSIGYAFGLGLERLAMILYDIPDIRLFWSTDSGFLNQFNENKKNMKYRPISQYPQCTNDLSFWLPQGVTVEDFCLNDFYDIVRDIGGDVVEQVSLIDQFIHPKTTKTSLCFRIVYRHMERTLKQNEVNCIHDKIAQTIVNNFNVLIR